MSKKSNERNKRSYVACTEVVQVSLFPEVVENVESMVFDAQGIVQVFEELAKSGYSVTIMHDSGQGKYSVRLAGIDEDCVNAGKLLYGNGVTFMDAFLSMYAKHFLISKATKWVASSPSFSTMS